MGMVDIASCNWDISTPSMPHCSSLSSVRALHPLRAVAVHGVEQLHHLLCTVHTARELHIRTSCDAMKSSDFQYCHKQAETKWKQT